jgi:ABC-type branched-subunit amino acid transport system substrate-binding protein
MFGSTRAASVALAAIVVASLGGCTGSPQASPTYVAPPGVTDGEITLGTHAPLTGPAAAGYSKVAAAAKAYFDFVNAKAGGVNGRKINFLVEDDAGDPAKTQTVVRKLVEQDKVFAIVGGVGTATHKSVVDYLKDQQIPDLFVASGATAWNQPARYPGTFGFETDYTTEGKIIGYYLKNTQALASQKICSFGQDDDLGQDFRAGLEKGFGAPVAVSQTYLASNTDVAPQVQAMQSAGCQVVVLATTPIFTAQTIITAGKLSYRPQFVSSSVGSDYATVAGYLGIAAGLVEGLISDGFLPIATNPDDPWIKLFTDVNKQYGDGGPVDNNVLLGMSIAYATVQALQRAGRDITVDNLIAAIEQGGFRGPGLVPFGFSATSHAGYSGARMTKVTNGVQNYFGPAYVTDAGSAPVTEDTEPTAVPPSDGIPTP